MIAFEAVSKTYGASGSGHAALSEVSLSVIRAPAGQGPVLITVRDTGPGIPADDLARIFRAFERSTASAKANDEGTGLGLHISQKLAELLNGTITVASAVGAGSTFTVTLAGS